MCYLCFCVVCLCFLLLIRGADGLTITIITLFIVLCVCVLKL